MMFLLALGSAVFYVAATFVMKYWGSLGAASALLLIVITLGVAVLLEVIALREAKLGYLYVVILGIECVLAMAAACWILRESYSPQELMGVALIVVGLAVLHLPQGAGSDEQPAEIGEPAPAASAIGAIDARPAMRLPVDADPVIEVESEGMELQT